MTTPATDFELSLSTPGDWIVVDPSTLSDTATVDGLVGSHLDAVPELAGRHDELVASVQHAMASAADEGVVFMAVLADPGGDGPPMLANLAVLTSSSPLPEGAEDVAAAPDEPSSQGSGAPAELADLEQILAGQPSEGDVDQRVIHSVLLSGGPAIRIARMLDVPLTVDGPMLNVLSVQYFFTVHTTGQLVILNFTTPTIGAHLPMQAIFHEIADSVRIG